MSELRDDVIINKIETFVTLEKNKVIIDTIINLLENFECETIYVFGSYASGKTHNKSDIDIAFLSKNKIGKYDIFMKAQEISSSVNKEIDLVDLKDSSTVFQNEVVKNGIVILDGDIIKRQKFEVLVLKKYIELNELRKDIIQSYSNSLDGFIKSRE
ncbi:MAG: type VII toxin-antitoxin system MntA family adenylyltransferase antitoxin [Cetobacterium sp.]